MTSFSLMFLLLNITLGEIDRPQLLTRTFDRNYLVKYLGIDAFTVYDGLKTAKTSQTRSKATGADLNKIIDFTQANYVLLPIQRCLGSLKIKISSSSILKVSNNS